MVRTILAPLKDAPRSALWLGLAGLVPFFAGVVLFLQASGETLFWLAYWQVSYGAIILSFLGGVRWGAAMAAGSSGQPSDYAFAIVPPLLAWIAVLQGLIWLVLVSLLAVYLTDRMTGGRALFPPWYLALRFVLTSGAAAALMIVALLMPLRLAV